MPLDTQAISAVLNRIASESYAFLKRPTYRNDLWITLSYGANFSEQVRLNSMALSLRGQESNHEKLARLAFEEARQEDVRTLRQLLLDAIPALDHRLFYFDLELRDPTKGGRPRFRFSICTHQQANSPVQLGTLVRKLERMAQNIGPVPKPEARVFFIEGTQVPAADPYAALRVYAALAMPQIFDTPPEVTPPITISEKLDPTPLFWPIFDGAKSEV